MIKNIGILTSGGDSPGMNAVIRGIVRSSIFNGFNVFGIKNGFLGLYLNKIIKLNKHDVSDIINRGGTFLGSSRFENFKIKDVRLKSVENLYKNNINILIIIGGNGSYLGALKLIDIGFPCICIPGTIDNDVYGTDYSIGFFTALENIVESIDKLRDTSSSHNRIFIVEVMGRNCGDLAILSSIAGGCEYVILPKIDLDEIKLINKIKYGINEGKRHFIIISTENSCNVVNLSKKIEMNTGISTRYVILGYVQRGGKPTTFDRILASKMSNYAIEMIINKDTNKCIGIINEKIVSNDIKNCLKIKNSKNYSSLLKLIEILF